MTLVFEGIPSAGGPRSRRSRGGRFWLFLSPLASSEAVLVMSLRGSASPAASPEASSLPFFSSSCDPYVSAQVGQQTGNKMTHPSGVATATATTATTATTAATTTTRSSAAVALRTRTLSVSTLGLLASRLGLASELNRDLALEDLLAGELGNGTLGLVGG